MTHSEKHKHFTTASIRERLIFKSVADANPNLFSDVIYSDPEGYDGWDVIFILSGETKPRVVETKVRSSTSTHCGYTIQEDKYQSLMVSACTYVPTYINFFNDDNQMLLWSLTGDTPTFIDTMYQNNNHNQQRQIKLAADLPATAATRFKANYDLTAIYNKADKIYNDRLHPEHPKKWKRI
ncbi:MAG: hypothetical protein K0S53_383 [Bacteroidetes bacterium]|nr:hypothetical protein [Bacteroidota bacterium]